MVSMELFDWVRELVIKGPLKKSQLMGLQIDQLVTAVILAIDQK